MEQQRNIQPSWTGTYSSCRDKTLKHHSFSNWYVNGQRHRVDGPAIEQTDGDKSWHLYGKCVTEAEHYAQTCVYQFIMQKPNTAETAP